MTPSTSSNSSQKWKESSNELHLKLPVVTCEKSLNGKALGETPLELELEKASSADGDDDDDEELFCRQHLMRNKKRMSSELRDLYEVLQQLPLLPSSSSAYRTGKKSDSVSGERTLRWVASTSKITAIGSRQRGISSSTKSYRTLQQEQAPQYTNTNDLSSSLLSLTTSNSLSTTSDCCAVCAENANALPRRAVIKMTHINLYESILPPSLFSCRHSRNQ